MSRDLTMLGCGFITGHLVWNMLAHGAGVGGLVGLLGVAMVIGSRYGIFGKVPPATSTPVVLIEKKMK